MFNPNYEGEVVVQNGTYTAVRSKAQYTRSAFGAHWDVVLTATVDACVSGDCNSSVEFSWGCGMDAPEIDVPEIVPRSGEVATNATLSPYFYNFYDPPYNNTMTCHGTVELSYTFLKYGSFWVTTNDTEIARVNMFGPHAGTTRFEADGNVTFFAIGTTLCIRGGTCGYFRYSWGCNEAAPALGNGNLRPYTFEPACGTHNTLGLAGSVSTNTTGTECWEIACNQGRVDITFTYFNTRLDKNYMNVYEMVDGKVAEFAFHESGEVQDVTHSFSGTVILQFYVFSWYTAMGKTLEFDYVCVGGVEPTSTPPTLAPPPAPITSTPAYDGPCTNLSALSGTVDTSLPTGAVTCWTVQCVGVFEIVFNPNYEGEVVVQNGTYTAVRSKAQYTRSAFGAHWDVVLTATVDACVSGDCNSSVEFSWGCGMDAPEIDVPEIVPRSGEVATNATLSPYFYNFYDPPYNNTMTCHGTVELSYTFLKYGSFWVTTNDTEIARVNMFGPHAGTTRFEADGNVTFFARGTTLCIRGGTCGYFRYSWGCNEAAPALGNGNLRPYTFEPSCGTHNTLGLAGSVSTNTTGTECWEIACNQGRVDITFTYFNTRLDKNYMNVYEMVDGKVAEFAFHESGEVQDVTHSFSGTVILQFYVFSWYTAMGKTLEFDYVCVGGVEPTPVPPVVPITPTPSSAGPCTTLSALSGSLDTLLSPGSETCWTLSCVGRLQITYNPSFDGKFVVENGTTTTLRTDAHYNSVTFNAYWDVKLTAAVDSCVGGDCSSSVEFSWGCGMDAPEIDAAHTTHDASNSAPDSATVTPNLGYDYFYTPLVNTIFCDGTLEMNYQLFYVGNFSVNNEDEQVFYTTAYGPHFGTTRFTADGNVSFLAQGRNCYRGGCGGFQYSWGCNMAAPQISMSNPAAFNFTPSCPTTTSLPDGSGTLSTQTSSTECWSIACEGGRVGIRFNTFDTTAGTDYVNVYEMEGDEITGFPFHESGEKNDTSYTFAGSVLVQFRSGWYVTGNGSLDFDYICMSGTGAPATLAPSTDAPPTLSPPTAAPVTSAPVTPAPPTAAPVTPAPATDSPRSSLVKWCVSDEECTKYGDMGATCDTDKNQCTCGTGFDKPRNKRNGDVSHICVDSATRVSDVVRATLDVDCDDGAGKGRRLASVVKSVVQGTVSETETECGSLNVFVHMDNVPLLDVAALDMVEELTAGMSAANDVVGTVQSAGLASMDALQCRDVTGAEVVVILGGVCVPLNCAAGHVLLGRVCTLLTPTPQTDDDFPVGAIVGICVGGVALLLIVLLGLFVVCKKDNKATPALETEPIAAENKAEGV